MKKILKYQFILLSVAFNLAFGAMWIAYGKSETPQTQQLYTPAECNGMVCCPLHQQLNVSEKQWTVIEMPLEVFHQCCKTLDGDIDKHRLELIDLLAAPQVDMAAIQAKQKDVLACQEEMQKLIIEQLLAEKDVLTPEQQKQLFTLLR